MHCRVGVYNAENMLFQVLIGYLGSIYFLFLMKPFTIFHTAVSSCSVMQLKILKILKNINTLFYLNSSRSFPLNCSESFFLEFLQDFSIKFFCIIRLKSFKGFFANFLLNFDPVVFSYISSRSSCRMQKNSSRDLNRFIH